MNKHLRFPNPWTQLAFFFFLWGSAILVSLIISTALITGLHIDMTIFSNMPKALQDRKTINLLKALQAISSLVIFLLPGFIFPRIVFTGHYQYFLGMKKADHANMYLLAVIGIVMALPLVFWLGELNRMIPLPESLSQMGKNADSQIEAFLHDRSPLDITLNIVLLALIPAIGEELCFRAVLQRIMIQLTGKPFYGILLTGFIFSAVHFQFDGFLPRMLLGVVLGAFFWYSGSIWTSIVAHFVNNAIQVATASIFPEVFDATPKMPVLLVVSSSIGLAAIVYYYAKESRQSFQKIYAPEELGPQAPYIADR